MFVNSLIFLWRLNKLGLICSSSISLHLSASHRCFANRHFILVFLLSSSCIWLYIFSPSFSSISYNIFHLLLLSFFTSVLNFFVQLVDFNIKVTYSNDYFSFLIFIAFCKVVYTSISSPDLLPHGAYDYLFFNCSHTYILLTFNPLMVTLYWGTIFFLLYPCWTSRISSILKLLFFFLLQNRWGHLFHINCVAIGDTITSYCYAISTLPHGIRKATANQQVLSLRYP